MRVSVANVSVDVNEMRVFGELNNKEVELFHDVHYDKSVTLDKVVERQTKKILDLSELTELTDVEFDLNLAKFAYLRMYIADERKRLEKKRAKRKYLYDNSEIVKLAAELKAPLEDICEVIVVSEESFVDSYQSTPDLSIRYKGNEISSWHMDAKFDRWGNKFMGYEVRNPSYKKSVVKKASTIIKKVKQELEEYQELVARRNNRKEVQNNNLQAMQKSFKGYEVEHSHNDWYHVYVEGFNAIPVHLANENMTQVLGKSMTVEKAVELFQVMVKV